MNKNILATVVGIVIIAGAFYATGFENKNDKIDKPNEEKKVERENIKGNQEFIYCLEDAGVVIYGSSTCPACAQLEQEYSGYETIKPIYLDCSGRGAKEETERCMDEMQTNFVPEVQIEGEVFNDWASPKNLAQATGCQL